jgi:hypothetical protein
MYEEAQSTKRDSYSATNTGFKSLTFGKTSIGSRGGTGLPAFNVARCSWRYWVDACTAAVKQGFGTRVTIGLGVMTLGVTIIRRG